MKVSILIVFLFGYFLTCETTVFVRLTRVVCEISRKTIPQQPDCFMKTYNKQTHLTVRFNMTRHTPNLKLDFSYSFKNSDGYSKVLGWRNLKFCKLIENANSALGLFKTLFDRVLKNINGNALEMCTIQSGLKVLDNVTFSDFGVLYETWPMGDYLTSHYFYDKYDQNVLNVTLYSRVYRK